MEKLRINTFMATGLAAAAMVAGCASDEQEVHNRHGKMNVAPVKSDKQHKANQQHNHDQRDQNKSREHRPRALLNFRKMELLDVHFTEDGKRTYVIADYPQGGEFADGPAQDQCGEGGYYTSIDVRGLLKSVTSTGYPKDACDDGTLTKSDFPHIELNRESQQEEYCRTTGMCVE